MRDKGEISYYAVIPATVRYDKEIPTNAKLLYGEVTSLCNKEGVCWADNSYFAWLYEVSIRTVQRWVASLVERGYLLSNIQYAEDGKTVIRRCLSIADTPNVTTPWQNCRGGGGKNVVENNTSMNNINNSIYSRRLNNSYSARAETTTTTFHAPSIEEVRAFAKKNNFIADPDVFYHYNNDNDWKKVTSWHASFLRWEKMEKERAAIDNSRGSEAQKPNPAEAIISSRDYERGEIRAALNADPVYRRLAGAYNKASLALAKAELEGRPVTDELTDAFNKALSAMNDRIREMGFSPEEC